jgi:UDP-3-O-[3-hydroxymyristoyl] N-acetylglucosamine deacetylase/3-hydroxyacyl-[acyl-carrier-protein] dehydratase
LSVDLAAPSMADKFSDQSMKQRTLLGEVSLTGTALHTGDDVTLTMKPAPADHGVVFRRIDLHGSPEIKPHVSNVSDLVRSTTISSGHAQIHTVEHVLSALHGYSIDNVVVEMNASEPPIMDGSARPYVNLILEGEPVEQDKDREFFELEEPISVTRGNSSLIALPSDQLKISCTSADDRGIHTQHLSIALDPETYATQIAAARTFTIYEDIEELLKLGKIKGGSLDCAIVLKGDKVISKEPLRFPDEFVRHKILDIIGDILLVGKPIRAHIVAVRPGHAINADLTKALAEKLDQKNRRRKTRVKKAAAVFATETSLDIKRVLETLPHRYPFLMIDKVVEFVGDNELTAVKNISFNEPYFIGHFPDEPVMPGVLQIEAMAQAAGIIMLRRVSNEGRTAFFMSCDKVKFRKAVRPGDQLVIRAKLTKSRGNKIGVAEATCTVDGEVVSTGELMFALLESEGGK